MRSEVTREDFPASSEGATSQSVTTAHARPKDLQSTQGRTPVSRPTRAALRNVTDVAPAVLAVLGALVLWHGAVVVFNIPSRLLPTPIEVLGALIENAPVILENCKATAEATLMGFGLSIVIGIPIAILMSYSRILEQISYPLLIISQTIPKIAIAPLLVIWFGFGTFPKVLVAFLIAFFPIVINTAAGLASTSPELVRAARIMGAKPRHLFQKVRFPNAMPLIFAGLKLAITLSVMGTVVGEFVASNSGLGYLLLSAQGNVQTPLMFASIVGLSVMAAAMFVIVAVVERRVTWWVPRGRARERARTK